MIIELPFVSTLLERLTEAKPLMQFLIGPRQVGKTTGIEQLIQKFDGPTHYQLVEGELNPDPAWLRLQWQKAVALGPESLLIIDEIQKVENWAEALKSLWDESRKNRISVKCVFLGSSSLNLRRGLNESLTGRYELTRAYHWDLAVSRKLVPAMSIETFLRFGGYPGSYRFLEDPDRLKSYVRDSIVKNVIERDILLNHTVKKPALFKQCAELLASYPAQEISFTKLLGLMQEGGNVEIVKHYLQLFEGAYLFSALGKYSPKATLKRSSSPKILPLCPALVEALSEEAIPEGRLLEVAVGSKLAEISDHLYYWRDGAHEVDFVAVLDKKIFAIEVKSGRRKQSQGLGQFVARSKKAIPVIIDKDQFESLAHDGKRFLEKLSGKGE